MSHQLMFLNKNNDLHTFSKGIFISVNHKFQDTEVQNGDVSISMPVDHEKLPRRSRLGQNLWDTGTFLGSNTVHALRAHELKH